MLKIKCSDLPESERCMRRMFANNLPDYVRDLGYSLRKSKSTGAKLVVASTVRKTITEMFTQKAAKGDINIHESYDTIDSELNRHEEESGEIDYNKAISSKDKAREICRKMVAVFKRDFAGHFVFPENVELSNVINVERVARAMDGKIELSGKVPIVTDDSIMMYKFSSAYVRTQHSQLGGYNLLLGNYSQEWKSRVLNVPLVGVNKLQPGIEIHGFGQREYLMHVAKNCLKMIDMCVERLKAGIDPEKIPCNPHYYTCSEKYCSAFKTNFCRRHM